MVERNIKKIYCLLLICFIALIPIFYLPRLVSEGLKTNLIFPKKEDPLICSKWSGKKIDIMFPQLWNPPHPDLSWITLNFVSFQNFANYSCLIWKLYFSLQIFCSISPQLEDGPSCLADCILHLSNLFRPLQPEDNSTALCAAFSFFGNAEGVYFKGIKGNLELMLKVGSSIGQKSAW